jgi:hypothetical protein
MKPILFNTEMVRAILEGRKTATRRAVKPQPESRPTPMKKDSCWPGCFAIQGTAKVIRPPYQPGDTLWVRETWAKSMAGTFMYQADDKAIMVERWRPSIHMPREAARLFLRVTGVRVERLKDIDGHGILKEGIDNGKSNPAMGTRWENMQSMAFAELWNSTLKPADLPLYGWAANPWVWVIEFERISKDEAMGGGGDD